MLLNSGYIGNLEITRAYLGDTLVWESNEPPVGRVFNVGTGGGSLSIDGNNIGGGLIIGDTVIVEPGSYSSVSISNINIPAGSALINMDDCTVTGLMSITNTVGADIVGTSFENNPNRAIELVPGNLGNLKLRNMSFSNVSDYTINYNGYSEESVIGGLEISGCTFDDCLGIILSATVNIPNGVDNGRVNNLKVFNTSFVNGNSPFVLKCDNVDKYEVHDITINDHTDTTLSHARLIHMAGEGDIWNIKAEDYYGNIAVQWPFSRNAESNGLCRMWNIIGRNCGRYSVVEVQNFSNYLESGVTSPCDVVIAYITGIDITGKPQPEEFAGVIADLYTGTFAGRNTVNIHNCVLVNTNMPEGNQFRGYQFVINNVNQEWENVVYSNNLPYNESNTDPAQHGSFPTADNPYEDYTDIGLEDVVEYKPGTGSLLIGEGVTVADMGLDYHGALRANPPSVGACEPA